VISSNTKVHSSVYPTIGVESGKKVYGIFFGNSRKYKKLLGNNDQKVENKVFQFFIFLQNKYDAFRRRGRREKMRNIKKNRRGRRMKVKRMKMRGEMKRMRMRVGMKRMRMRVE